MGLVKPWLIILVLAMVFISSGYAKEMKEYQYCGGDKGETKVISLSALEPGNRIFALISPTIAVRLNFNRSDNAANVLDSQTGDLLMWNCSKIMTLEKYELQKTTNCTSSPITKKSLTLKRANRYL